MHTSLRVAGWAAIAAGGAHLVQFAVLGIGPALSEPDFPAPAHAADNYWFGIVGLATFTLVALAYLLFFPAATAVVLPRGGEASRILRGSLAAAATIGVAGWVFAGASNLARRGFNATAIDAASGGDAAVGRAVLQGAYLTTSTLAIGGAVALAVWFAAFAVLGLRAKTIGAVVAIAALIAGIVPLAGWLANLGGVPAITLALLVIGPALLARARRLASQTAESAPTEHVAQ